MKNQAICPICGSPVDRYDDYLDGGTLEESTMDCPVCGYSYSYSYGYTQVKVGDQLFQWGWLDNPRNESESLACWDAVEQAQANWVDTHPNP